MGGMGAMWLWTILGLAGLWGLVACAARWVMGPRRPDADRGALQVLDQRLARGEITTEEYRRARQLLTTGH